MYFTRLFVSAVAGACALGLTFCTFGQGTAFSYQGQLSSNGGPANGSYDFRFRLATDPLANNYVGSNVLNNAVPVSNGLFVVVLDFGPSVFTGTNLWLEVDVRTNGGGIYTVLNPLQAITPAPYAIRAANATTLTGPLPAAQLSGTLPSAQLSGTYSGPVSFVNGANTFNGAFFGDGGGLTNVAHLGSNQTFTGQNVFTRPVGIGNEFPFWSLDVLASQAVGRFVSTNAGFGSVIELQNFWTNSPQYLGAINFNNTNFTTPGQIGYISRNPTNQNLDYLAMRVGGAIGFQIFGDPRGAGAPNVVGGFAGNSILEGSGGSAIVGGGFPGIPNLILSNSSGALIGGGSLNSIGPNVNDSVIVGGYQNSIHSWDAAIGGGYGNSIDTNSTYAVIGGGYGNLIQTNGLLSTIAGGYFNVVNAPYAFAAGVGAVVNHSGSTMFTDGRQFYTYSTRANEFFIRAQNGVNISSDVGIHLNAADLPMIVRDWDVFSSNAPPWKAGIGRWGMFMEPGNLVLGIPGDDLLGRGLQVGKYSTNGSYTQLMRVDQFGNVFASNFVGSGASLSGLNLSGTYPNPVTLNNPANSFAGNGSGLVNVDAATLGGLASSAYAKLNSSPVFTGPVTAPGVSAGNAQFTGLIRSGAENVGELPIPAGLVFRRVNSISQTNVIAAVRVPGSVTNVALVRDGSVAGFQIKVPGNIGRLTVACMGIDALGNSRNYYTNFVGAAAPATLQVYADAQNMVHFQCSFGDTYDSGQNMTQVTLSRFATDNFWAGTLTSTFNQ